METPSLCLDGQGEGPPWLPVSGDSDQGGVHQISEPRYPAHWPAGLRKVLTPTACPCHTANSGAWARMRTPCCLFDKESLLGRKCLWSSQCA